MTMDIGWAVPSIGAVIFLGFGVVLSVLYVMRRS